MTNSTKSSFSRVPLIWKIKHILKNKRFYIEWWLGMRTFKPYWSRCHQHENCWVMWYDKHFRDIKHQIDSHGWTNNYEPYMKGGHGHTGFDCSCGLPN